MQARPCPAAQPSSATALVPFMSDLKPPSQKTPGAAPGRTRTAIRRVADPVPNFEIFQANIVHSSLRSSAGEAGIPIRVSPQAGVRRKGAAPPHGRRSATRLNRWRSAPPMLPRRVSCPAPSRAPPCCSSCRRSRTRRRSAPRSMSRARWCRRARVRSWPAKTGLWSKSCKSFGGEWLPFVSTTFNPMKLRSNAAGSRNSIAEQHVDIVHA